MTAMEWSFKRSSDVEPEFNGKDIIPAEPGSKVAYHNYWKATKGIGKDQHNADASMLSFEAFDNTDAFAVDTDGWPLFQDHVQEQYIGFRMGACLARFGLKAQDLLSVIPDTLADCWMLLASIHQGHAWQLLHDVGSRQPVSLDPLVACRCYSVAAGDGHILYGYGTKSREVTTYQE